MTWYASSGNETGVAVSTRVRLARNIKGIPFPALLDEEKANDVIERVWAALDHYPQKDDLTLIRMRELSALQKSALIEKHLISADLAKSPVPSAVIVSSDESIAIMINEEDHIRIQVLSAGLSLRETYDTADKLDTLLSETLVFDYHDRFGFLTACPTNVGTGMRASVMLHLPSISETNNINNILSWAGKLGLTVRGLYGEGTQGLGRMYQLSNQVTLGPSEDDILGRLGAAAHQLIAQERELQSKIYQKKTVGITDRVMRAKALLLGAYTLSSDEAIKLISDVHLGINLGIIKDIDLTDLTSAMILSLPANLSLKYDCADSASRDIRRAEFMREKLLKKEAQSK